MQGDKELFGRLGQIEPKKPYGVELFDALARLTITVAVEAVCLKRDAHEQVQVYLVQRAQDDTAYPGQWHCPGSAMRPGEEIQDVIKRLEKKEFDLPLLSSLFVENFNHPGEERGHFFSLIYLCSMGEKEGMRGKWFPIDGLPEKMVEHHRQAIIPIGVKAL